MSLSGFFEGVGIATCLFFVAAVVVALVYHYTVHDYFGIAHFRAIHCQACNGWNRRCLYCGQCLFGLDKTEPSTPQEALADQQVENLRLSQLRDFWVKRFEARIKSN